MFEYLLTFSSRFNITVVATQKQNFCWTAFQHRQKNYSQPQLQEVSWNGNYIEMIGFLHKKFHLFIIILLFPHRIDSIMLF